MADEVKTNEKVKDLTERVKVIATDKHPFAEKGDVFEVHPDIADMFLKKGFVKNG